MLVAILLGIRLSSRFSIGNSFEQPRLPADRWKHLPQNNQGSRDRSRSARRNRHASAL